MTGLPIALACIALGGGLGGLARVWMTAAIDGRLGGRFPWGTLAVNGVGSACLGLLAGLLPAQGLAWALLGIGLLGSFTTVSAFSLQTLGLWQRGDRRAAALNMGGSLGLCLGAAAGGLALGGWLAGD